MRTAAYGAFPAIATLILAAGCGPAVPLSRPQWSPRGDRAAFVRYDAEGGDLYLLDPGGEDGPRLVEKRVERFCFSPDGGRLYYLRPAAKGTAAGGSLVELDVYATDLDKSMPRALLVAEKGASLDGLQVGPDGVVYVAKTSAAGGRVLLRAARAGERVRDLTAGAKDWTLLPAEPRSAAMLLAVHPDVGGPVVTSRTLPDGKSTELARLAANLERVDFLAASDDWGKLLLVAGKNEKQHLLLLVTAAGKTSVSRLEIPGGAGGEGERIPVAAGFSPLGAAIRISIAVDVPEGELRCESWELDPAAGRSVKLAEAAGRLVGAPGWGGPGGSRLEFTPGGLALFRKGGKTPAGIWPLSTRETADAARAFLAAGDAGEALKVVSRALSATSPEDDLAVLYVVKSDVLTALGKKAEAANAYMESLLRHPVTNLVRSDREIAKTLSAWVDQLPENRILALLAGAYAYRARGDFLGAARSFKEAASYSGDRAWAAGLLFGYARSLLDAGRAAAAGPIFRKASEFPEFPQADWAAGLCVLAYASGGREDMAGEELQRCLDLHGRSILADDFRALGAALKDDPGESRTAENAPGSEGSAARLEAWPYRGVHVSLSPREVRGAGGSHRLALTRYDLYRVVLAPAEGPQKAILDRVPVRLSNLSFSPKGDRLAFLAGEEGERSLYAVDLAGRAQLGDLAGLLEGRLDAGSRAESYSWDGDRPVAGKAEE